MPTSYLETSSLSGTRSRLRVLCVRLLLRAREVQVRQAVSLLLIEAMCMASVQGSSQSAVGAATAISVSRQAASVQATSSAAASVGAGLSVQAASVQATASAVSPVGA